MQQQIRPLIGGEAARKSESERIWFENPLDLCNFLGRCAMPRNLARQPLSYEFDERFSGGRAHLPDMRIGDSPDILFEPVQIGVPALFATGFSPQIVGLRRLPDGNV